MSRRSTQFLLIAVILVMVVVPVAAIGASSFIDVPEDRTFKADIDWLASAGVTKGCNPPHNDRFCPDAYVTRGQMAAFMHRLASNRVVDAKSVGGLTWEDLTDRQIHRFYVVGTGSDQIPGFVGTYPSRGTATAWCSPGDIATGAGFDGDIGGSGGAANLVVERSLPVEKEHGVQGWEVTMRNESSFLDAFNMYVTCIDYTS
jgi:hypothetical protein